MTYCHHCGQPSESYACDRKECIAMRLARKKNNWHSSEARKKADMKRLVTCMVRLRIRVEDKR